MLSALYSNDQPSITSRSRTIAVNQYSQAFAAKRGPEALDESILVGHEPSGELPNQVANIA